MNAFFYGVILQWKLDLRNRGVLLTYYVVPLIFFLMIGGVFTTINPDATQTLIQSMTVFAVSMGALLGSPIPLVEFYGSDMKKAYQVGKIPLWTLAANHFISGFVHLFIVSALIFVLAPLVFHAAIPENIALFSLNLALFILTCLAVGLVLGLAIKNMSKLTMFSQLLFLPSIMLSGIMFPVDLLPGFLQVLGKCFPATWGYAAMCQTGVDVSALLILTAIALLALALGLWRLKQLKHRP